MTDTLSPSSVPQCSDQRQPNGTPVRLAPLHEFAILAIASVALLTWVDHSAIFLRPLDYGDLTVPYLQGGIAEQLSGANPWYGAFVRMLYLAAGSGFGLSLNLADVYSYALAPLSMLFCLSQFGLSRLGRLLGAGFYLANPVVLGMAAPGYVSWSLFLAAAPVALGLLVVYERTNMLRHILSGLSVASLLVLLDPIVGPRLILPVVIGPLLLPIITHRQRTRLSVLTHVLAGSIVLALSILSTIAGIASRIAYAYSSGSSYGSAFYQFHIGNVVYTYHSQTFLNSLAALTLYPSSQLASYGYSGTLVWLLWILVVASALFAVLLRSRNPGSVVLVLVASTLVIVAFQVGVQTGQLLWVFRVFPPLFDYEYPNILNFVQIVYYSVFFGILVELVERAVTFMTPSRGGNMRSFVLGPSILRIEVSPIEARTRLKRLTRLGTPGARTLVFASATAVILAILICVNIPTLAASVGSHTQPANDRGNYLPEFYASLSAFFKDRVGDSRVLPLPLNYTTIIRMDSVLPPSRIFGIPYGGVNSPDLYPNQTQLLGVLHEISSDDAQGFTDLLTLVNVEYVVIFDPTLHQPLSLSLTSYNSYLNGGGFNFLDFFSRVSQIETVATTPDYVILKNPSYSFPVNVPSAVYNLAPGVPSYTASLGEQLPQLSNPFLLTHTAWSQWSSCSGSQANYIQYNALGAHLTTCTSQNATGSKTNTAQTEIYQRLTLFPREQLSVVVNVSSLSSGVASLIVIFHNASSAGQFYSNEQDFPAIPSGYRGMYTYNITCPSDSSFGYLGVQLFNSGSSVASLTVGEVQGYSIVTYSHLPLLAPFLPPRSLAIPSVDAMSLALRDFPAVVVFAPVLELPPTELTESLGSAQNGSVYLASGMWNLRVNCEVQTSRQLAIELGLENTTAVLSINGSTSLNGVPGWNYVPTDCNASAPALLSINLTGMGHASIYAVDLITGPIAPSPMCSPAISRQGSAEYRVSVSTSGTCAVDTAEVPSITKVYGPMHLSTDEWNGTTFFIVNASGPSSFVISFNGLRIVSPVSILTNLTAFAGVLGVLILSSSSRVQKSLIRKSGLLGGWLLARLKRLRS